MERKIKLEAYVVMVIFDFIIMMPTLSINSISFLNQTFLSLSSSSKTKQPGNKAHFQTIQRQIQLDLRDFPKMEFICREKITPQVKPQQTTTTWQTLVLRDTSDYLQHNPACRIQNFQILVHAAISSNTSQTGHKLTSAHCGQQ